MKTVRIPVEGLSVKQLVRKAAKADVVFLTTGGEIRFALLPADEGDQEILALRANPGFMQYLDERVLEARTRPRKSIAEIRKKFGLGPGPSNRLKQKTRRSATRTR